MSQPENAYQHNLRVPQILCTRHKLPITDIDISQVSNQQSIERLLCESCREVFSECIPLSIAYKRHIQDNQKWKDIIDFNHSNYHKLLIKTLQQILDGSQKLHQRTQQNLNLLKQINLSQDQLKFTNITQYSELQDFAKEHQRIYYGNLSSEEYLEQYYTEISQKELNEIVSKNKQILEQVREDLEYIQKLINFSQNITTSLQLKNQLNKSILGQFKNQLNDSRALMQFDQNEENLAIQNGEQIQILSKGQNKQFLSLGTNSTALNQIPLLIRSFKFDEQLSWFAFNTQQNLYFGRVSLDKKQIFIKQQFNVQSPILLEVDSVHKYCFIFFAKECKVWINIADQWQESQSIRFNSFYKAQFSQGFSLLLIQQEKLSNYIDIYKIDQQDQSNQQKQKIIPLIANVELKSLKIGLEYQIFFFSLIKEHNQQKGIYFMIFQEDQLYFQKVDEQSRATETISHQKMFPDCKFVYFDGSKILACVNNDNTLLYLYKFEISKTQLTQFTYFTHIQVPAKIINLKLSTNGKFLAMIDGDSKSTIYNIQLLPRFSLLQGATCKCIHQFESI